MLPIPDTLQTLPLPCGFKASNEPDERRPPKSGWTLLALPDPSADALRAGTIAAVQVTHGDAVIGQIHVRALLVALVLYNSGRAAIS